MCVCVHACVWHWRLNPGVYRQMHRCKARVLSLSSTHNTEMGFLGKNYLLKYLYKIEKSLIASIKQYDVQNMEIQKNWREKQKLLGSSAQKATTTFGVISKQLLENTIPNSTQHYAEHSELTFLTMISKELRMLSYRKQQDLMISCVQAFISFSKIHFHI